MQQNVLSLKRTLSYGIPLFMVIFLMLGTFYRVGAVHISQNGQPLYVLPIDDSETFTIRWIHSVELEAWEESFRITEGRIVLTSTRFKTYGAGVPSSGSTHTSIEEGWVVMSGFDRVLGSEWILRADPETRHVLMYNEASLPLSEAEDSRQIRIQYKRVPWIEYQARAWR